MANSSNKKKSNNGQSKFTRNLLIVLILLVIAVYAVIAGFIWRDQTEKNKQQTSENQQGGTKKDENIVSGTDTAQESSEDVDQQEHPASEDTDAEDIASESSDDTQNEGDTTSEIEQLLAAMSLEQKVGQMFMITPEALVQSKGFTAAGPITQAAFLDYPVGGIICFSKNIVNPEQTKKMTKNLKQYGIEAGGVPLLLAIDEEGGRVTRIAGNTQFPVENVGSMQSIGKTGDKNRAYEAGVTIGSYLSEYGFNLDFAPVADVLTNAQNQVIGDRAFGSDAQLVADMDLAIIRGLQEQGICACMKHFPGHGSTAGDTHTGYVSTDRTLGELQSCELIPFQAGIGSGVPFILVSHIAVPEVTGNDVPATLSSALVTDLLRTQMGYDGIVITDAMNMGAVTEKYSSAEAAVGAVQAGVDIVLMPEDFRAAYQGLLDAVQDGTVPQSRIDASVRRILRVKLSYFSTGI